MTDSEKGLRFDFQNPYDYRPIPPEIIEGDTIINYMRLLYHCVYDFSLDVRYPKNVIAILYTNLFDSVLQLWVMPYIVDDITNLVAEPNYWTLYAILLCLAFAYAVYVYVAQWIVSKPLDQVYLRMRIFRHALSLPWAFWNTSADGSGEDPTRTEQHLTHLMSEDADIVMDVTCTVHSLINTLVHMATVLLVMAAKGFAGEGFRKGVVGFVIPLMSMHIFTFSVMHAFLGHIQFEHELRQRERDVRPSTAVRPCIDGCVHFADFGVAGLRQRGP